MRQIPAPILTAATGMLSPYFPDLTAARLVEALDRPGNTGPAPLPEAMTKRDVCRVAKISLQTCNRWLRSGRLASVKINRAVRIPRASVEALLSPALTMAPPSLN